MNTNEGANRSEEEWNAEVLRAFEPVAYVAQEIYLLRQRGQEVPKEKEQFIQEECARLIQEFAVDPTTGRTVDSAFVPTPVRPTGVSPCDIAMVEESTLCGASADIGKCIEEFWERQAPSAKCLTDRSELPTPPEEPVPDTNEPPSE